MSIGDKNLEKLSKHNEISKILNQSKVKSKPVIDPSKFSIKSNVDIPPEQLELLKYRVAENLIDDGYTPEQISSFQNEIRKFNFGWRIKEPWKFEDLKDENHTVVDTHLLEKAYSQYNTLFFHQLQQRRYLYDQRYKEVKDLEFNVIYETNPTYTVKNKIYPDWTSIRPMNKFKKNVRHTDISSVNLNSSEYLSKQPRINLNYNYNIEENKVWKFVYERSLKKDEERQAELIKKESAVAKYKNCFNDIKHSINTNDFFNKFEFDNKREFVNKNLNYFIPLNLDIIKKKSQSTEEILKGFKLKPKDLLKYDAWSSFDQKLAYYKNLTDNCRSIQLNPRKLKEKFSLPDKSINQHNTGHYYFQDNDLNVYLLFDYKQTTMTYGENLSDDLLKSQTEKEINPKYHILKSLTKEEFWNSDEERSFKILFTPYSNWRKFAAWLKIEVSF